jgi:hypothetical protein
LSLRPERRDAAGDDAIATDGFLPGSAVRLLASCFLLIAGHTTSPADEFRTAAISVGRPDWRAALDRLRSEINTQPAIAGNFTFSGRRRLPPHDPRAMPALLQLK